MQRLRDMVCVVTGGAQGIGKGICRRFLDEGAKVWIGDLRAEGIEQAVEELTSRGAVAGGAVDVGRRDQVEAMVAAVIKRWGRVDVLVNNAGIAHTAPFLEIEDADWDRILTTNLRGTFLCSQLVSRRMVDQGGGGSIVNIASTNGLRGQPMLGPYGASKAGIINLSMTAALELGLHGIRVNALCPGTIWTEASDAAGWAESVWADIRSHTALDRLGTPDDIAAATAFLASPDSAYVTGSVIVVDGGLTARQLNIDPASLMHRPTPPQ